MSKRIKNNNPKPVFSKNKLTNLVNHLKSIIKKLDGTNNSNWTNYYKETISGGEYHSTKETIVTNLLKQVNGNKLLDLGANDGFYSLLASKNNFEIVAVDNDDQSINNLYKRIQNENIDSILPLCIDISNPSSSSGFSNKERNAFDERINADVVLVLALVHHLTIGKNIPFDLLAPYFSKLAPQLIIEFVPKDDEKTQLLLKNRKDVFTIYTIEEFEKTFQQYFTIALTSKVPDTERLIYLMKRKTN
jgi:ribosomal protein L11 methylase PrmA